MSDDDALVLVSDDDDDLRDLVVFRLEKSGYRVVQARDGEEALAAAFEHSPDAIVRKLVEADEGEVELAEAPGGGLDAVVRLRSAG